MGVPSAPYRPTFSKQGLTTVTVSWQGSDYTGGKPINAYLLRRWNAATPTGPYYDSSANNRTRNITGLIPGNPYTFAVYAHNADGYSARSTTSMIDMYGGVWIRVGGKWKKAIPYVRYGGKWHVAIPYVRSGGTWHTMD